MNMERGGTFKINLKKIRILPLVAFLILPLSGFSQKSEDAKTPNSERAELNYKQRHSKVSRSSNLYADGIKIKRDLSILKEIQEERVLSADEIPAEELYAGIWNNRYVKAYGSVENIPDTFAVNLHNFAMPTMGHVTSNFGKRGRRMHYGIDLKLQTGDTVYAAFDGKIRVRQYERRGYGYYLVVRHPNGLETVYGHLSKFLVNEEDVVRSGQPIGLGGNTGRSFGSHLHFEFRFLGQPINPRDIVDFDNKVCHKDIYTITPFSFNYAGLSSKSAVRTGSYASSTSSTRSNTAVTNKYATAKYHKIQTGDSLSKIAKRYGLSISQLCKLNSINTRTLLRAGKSLRVS